MKEFVCLIILLMASGLVAFIIVYIDYAHEERKLREMEKRYYELIDRAKTVEAISKLAKTMPEGSRDRDVINFVALFVQDDKKSIETVMKGTKDISEEEKEDGEDE